MEYVVYVEDHSVKMTLLKQMYAVHALPEEDEVSKIEKSINEVPSGNATVF